MQRELLLLDLSTFADDQRPLEVEQVGVALPGLLPPGVEVPPGDDVRADPLVVEGEQRLVVDQQVAAPGALLELLDLLDQLAVLVEELVVGVPVAFDQRVPDEQLAGHLRVDLAVVDLAAGNDRYAVQGDLLVGHHRAGLAFPVRLGVRAFDQVLGEVLGPLRLDLGVDAGPQPGRLDEFGGHHELRWLLEQAGAGEDRELGAAGTDVLVLVGRVLHAEVGEQSGHQRDVDGLRVGRLAGVERDADLAATWRSWAKMSCHSRTRR